MDFSHLNSKHILKIYDVLHFWPPMFSPEMFSQPYYKVIHANLGKGMKGAEIKSFFFSPQTIPQPPLLGLTMSKKYRSWRSVCGCKVSWGFGRCTLGCIFIARRHWGHSTLHGKKDLLHMTYLGSTSTSWKPQAPMADKAGQDRYPRWEGQSISWKRLLVLHSKQSHKGSLSNYLIINTCGFGN